jgi:thiamine-phosphate pyrophosphorylase
VRTVAQSGITLPWFAIGGITTSNIREVLAQGATRIAVVRAILDSRDPAEAARLLADALAAVREGACA